MAKNRIIYGLAASVLVLAILLLFFGKGRLNPSTDVQSAQTPADQAGLARCLEIAKKQYDQEVTDWTRKLGGSTPPSGMVDPFKRALDYYKGEKHHCQSFYS